MSQSRGSVQTPDDGTKDTDEADDSILNPSGKGEHIAVTETDEETGREDTYEADDSILNPTGKGEHTEVTESREAVPMIMRLRKATRKTKAKMIVTTAMAMKATVMVVKAKAILPAAMIAATRTATITMVMRLIPATMGTLIATARVMNRDVSLIVTAVTAA
ncbi:MAG TPA: hypothetical protein VK494_03040 [Gemmatimonadaceae bacterium]|nr:hypothetical protein [Gemmatimonadaceae bacterium]